MKILLQLTRGAGLKIFERRIMDRAKSPNMATVVNARRMAKRKLQRSARRTRDKEEQAKKVKCLKYKTFGIDFLFAFNGLIFLSRCIISSLSEVCK